MSNVPLLPFDEADVRHAVSHVEASSWARLRQQRIFVTGGTGFVGKWLLATLQEARQTFDLDCDIVVLSRDPEGFRRHAPGVATADGVRLLRGNVLDFEFPAGEFGVVLHAAGDVARSSTPIQTFETCLSGTRRVLDLCARARTHSVLCVSSGAVYGRQPTDLAEIAEAYCGSPVVGSVQSAYGHGKRAAEWLTAAYAAEHGFRAVTARLFAVLGPGMPLDGHFAIGNFMRDAMAGAPIVIQGDGTALRSYLHAADMAGWIWKILLDGRAGEAYNVGGSEVVSMAELAGRVASLIGAAPGVEVRGMAAAGLSADRYVPDVSKARSELRLGAPWSLDESIRRTGAWQRKAAAQP